MPKPGPEHERLAAAMTGTWHGEETLHPSPWAPETRTAQSRIVSRRDLGDLFVVNRYVQMRDGVETFHGLGIYGWDPRARVFTMNWADSMTPFGRVATSTGTWEGDTLTFQNEGEFGHARYTYVFGDGTQHFSIDNSQDGNDWSRFVDVVFTRT